MLKKRKIKHIFIKLICKFYKNSFFNKIKMSCPNSNKNVIETFHKLGLLDTNLSPEDEASQRRRLYYTVCITFRLFLAGLLFQLRNTIIKFSYEIGLLDRSCSSPVPRWQIYSKHKLRWAVVVVVKWSACSPYTSEFESCRILQL